jgi:nitroreductase
MLFDVLISTFQLSQIIESTLVKKIIKNIVGGQQSIDRVLRVQGQLSIFWLRLAYRSRVMIRIHYCLFSGAFDQEAKAVIAGHLQFYRNQSGNEYTNYFLRRVIHRLEKGLIMDPRREVFATDYIEDAVNAYVQSLKKNGKTDELIWATDVLTQYFEVTGQHPAIERAKNTFQQLDRQTRTSSDRFPFPSDSSVPSYVTYDDMLALAKKRRSVRWYQNKPVPREDVDDAIAIALQSPSACNRQPYRFMVFDDPESIADVGTLPGGVRGFEHNFPMLIALVGRLRAYPHPRDRHVIYVDGGLAAMSFMFALETKGLASCSINWPDVRSKELAAAKKLNLENDERIIMFISVGYARNDGMIPYSQKLSTREAREFNPNLL